jgi:hypothetical protein
MKLTLCFFLILSSVTGQVMANNEKIIYGYVEKVTLLGKNLSLPAKLDTGAKSASLNAINIREIDINGVPFLRFTVPTKTGEVLFECEYIGKVKIKARAGESSTSRAKPGILSRPIVLMHLQLGNKARAIQVNLTNRKRFIYPLLLGRDAIKDFDGIIDPALSFTLKSKSIN